MHTVKWLNTRMHHNTAALGGEGVPGHMYRAVEGLYRAVEGLYLYVCIHPVQGGHWQSLAL
jgi:plastocyanin